jgi:hypothetical protein
MRRDPNPEFGQVFGTFAIAQVFCDSNCLGNRVLQSTKRVNHAELRSLRKRTFVQWSQRCNHLDNGVVGSYRCSITSGLQECPPVLCFPWNWMADRAVRVHNTLMRGIAPTVHSSCTLIPHCPSADSVCDNPTRLTFSLEESYSARL